ncbi:MAG: YfcE family phosphodiesterase [Planctomycetota bacterium]
MRLGLLADSHGRAERTATAVRMLLDAHADVLIHLGDFETDVVIDELAGHPARLVFGNCDFDVAGMTRYAQSLDIQVDHPIGRLHIDGKVVAYTHGHENGLVSEAMDEQVDYLLHGHTHVARDDREGKTRVINPGALHRANRYTVALLDVATDELTWLELPRT